MDKFKGNRFALLGVNTDHSVEKALKNKMPVRSWSDGAPDGPICTRWNIGAFPTWFLIDQRGTIILRNAVDEGIEARIEALLAH